MLEMMKMTSCLLFSYKNSDLTTCACVILVSICVFFFKLCKHDLQNNCCFQVYSQSFSLQVIPEFATMWPVFWTVMRTYGPYVTFPVAFVVGGVGYHLEWFIRGAPSAPGEERGIAEQREDRKLEELTGRDSTQVISLKDKLEFTPKAVLERNRPEKS